MTTAMKRCTKCGKEKPATSSFFNCAKMNLRPNCKECDAIRNRRYRQENIAKCAKQNRCQKMAQKGWDIESRLSAYGAQGGRCAVCKSPGKESGGSAVALHADHCHSTGKSRSLLCRSCNLALGNTGDDSGILLSLAFYIDGHAARHRGASAKELRRLRDGIKIVRAAYVAWREGKLTPNNDPVDLFPARAT